LWWGVRVYFPGFVADALATFAANDSLGLAVAIDSVVTSFETREDFLEDAKVADTAIVLHLLAERRGIAQDLPRSRVLP
jgi:hypothetical protein